MAKVIFRKIAGKIVPIRIGSVKDLTHQVGISARKITAHVLSGNEKTQIGRMNLIFPKKGVSVDLESVNVEQKFRGHGISRALFKYAQEFLGRIGKKFIRSSEIQHVAQVKIRSRAGKSVFFGTGFGQYGEDTRKLRGPVSAMRLIKNPGVNGQTVYGTTMIPKKFRIKKK